MKRAECFVHCRDEWYAYRSIPSKVSGKYFRIQFKVNCIVLYPLIKTEISFKQSGKERKERDSFPRPPWNFFFFHPTRGTLSRSYNFSSSLFLFFFFNPKLQRHVFHSFVVKRPASLSLSEVTCFSSVSRIEYMHGPGCTVLWMYTVGQK